jgi:TnpA family transposase
VVATQPEVTYVLDETLGNQTDLPIAEHATDTAGASLVNFALFDLVGRQFSPRIRDLARSPCTALAPRPKRPPGSDATLECTR